MSDADLRFPTIATVAGLAVVVGGILLIATGVQFLALGYAFGWVKAVPWLLIAVGLLNFPLGGALSRASSRVAPFTVASAWVSAGFVGLWALYLLFTGNLVPLPFVAAVGMGLAAILASGAYAPVRRYDAARLAAFGVEVKELSPADRAARRSGAFAVLGVAALAGLGWVAYTYPEQLSRAWLRVRMIGRSSDVSTWVGERADYAYQGSPFLRYLAIERRLVDFDDAVIARFADDVAQEVAWRMLVETGADDVSAAELALWRDGDARLIPLWIADALKFRGVIYTTEALLSRSFDPGLHSGEASFHLDCDQLVHLFAHVAWRLDLDMREVRSPMHMYLRYQPPSGASGEALTVETTGFRTINVEGGEIDLLGEAPADDFFVAEDHYSSGRDGTWASAPLVAAAALYQPATDRDIDDSIVANLSAELHDRETLEPLEPLMVARLEGTRSYLLVSNLYEWSMQDARAAIEAGQPDVALPLVERAVGLRRDHGPLLVHSEPGERVVEARARMLAGDADGARAALAAALPWYAVNAAVEDPPLAATTLHGELLILSAELDPPRTAAACDATLGAVIRWSGRLSREDRALVADACGLALGWPACAPLRERCEAG